MDEKNKYISCFIYNAKELKIEYFKVFVSLSIQNVFIKQKSAEKKFVLQVPSVGLGLVTKNIKRNILKPITLHSKVYVAGQRLSEDVQ